MNMRTVREASKMAAASAKELEKQLIEAVEITLEPNAAQDFRQEAYEFIEKFKADNQLCVPVGLSLFNKDNSPIVRHLGLQLLEHCVKFGWNTMETSQQGELKHTALKLVAQGTKTMLEEEHHIKESLARLVVEIIKREWPQKWESLLPDLNSICSLGNTQTELVFIVLLRLAEDIIKMDSHLQQQRKREVTQALHAHMEGLFTFFVDVLKATTVTMKEMAIENQRVAVQTLITMQGYLEWVKFNILFLQNCVLLQTLCLLLSEEELKLQASECLLIIVSRKGKMDHMQEFSKFFSEDAMEVMRTAAQKAAVLEYDEKQYLFLKRLCQVLTTMGTVQLTQMWSKERPNGKPANFRQYLEAIFAFSQHESLALSHLTNTLWHVMLRSDVMVVDEDIRSMMPRLLELGKTKILRAGDSTATDVPGSVYNREDFNSTREFTSMFAQVRSQMMDIIRLITLQFPIETFLPAAEWLIQNVENTKAVGSSTDPQVLEQLKIQWDGVSCYMEAVTSRLFKVENIQELLPRELAFRGATVTFLNLARRCIESLLQVDASLCNNMTITELKILGQRFCFLNKDPHVLANVADIIQSMLCFLSHAQDLILSVLKTIFKLVTFNTTRDPKPLWTLDVLHTRRRACSAVQQLCKAYGELLVPLFGELKKYVQSLFEGELVTTQDRTTLTEALVIASNFLTEENQRNEFLTELLTPVKALWMTDKFQEIGLSPEMLISFLGMDKEPGQYLELEEIPKKRFELMLGLTTILAIVRRCRVRNGSQAGATDRGSIGLMPDGAVPYVGSPCTSHILPFLPYLLVLIQSVNILHGTAARSAMDPAYIASLDMHSIERSAIFALQDPDATHKSTVYGNDPVIKTKHYIFYLTEACYTILGYAGEAAGAEFYSQPSLAQCIVSQVINNLHHLPNYRIRHVIRHFIRQFIIFCPPCYYEVALVPVLSAFFVYMLKRLEEEWQKVRARQSESLEADEQDAESKEVIEDQLVHLTTKDYMSAFYLACTTKREVKTLEPEVYMDQERDDDAESESTKKKEGAASADAQLGLLGEMLLHSETVNLQLLYTVFTCMTWLDSSACIKACRLSIPLTKKAIAMSQASGSHIPSAVIEQFFLQVLKGLQVQGESVQYLLIRIGQVLYEILQPQYSILKQILQQATGCTPEDLQTMEEACFGPTLSSEKRKRDLFRKVVQNILGKHIGQMFKNEIKIKDLPAIHLPPKPKQVSVHELEGSIGLADLFDPKKATELL